MEAVKVTEEAVKVTEELAGLKIEGGSSLLIIERFQGVDLNKDLIEKFETTMKKNKFGAMMFKANYLVKCEPLLLAASDEAEACGIPYTNAYMNLANLNAQKKEYQKACDYFLKVIAESPHNPANAGLKFSELQKNFVMSDHVNNYIAYKDAHTNLAFTYLGMSEPEKAYKWSKASLDLDYENKEAHINFGNALRQVGRREEAIDLTWDLIKRSYLKNHGKELEIVPIDLSKVEKIAPKADEVIRVITVKWGTKYDAEYVNKVYKGIKRYTKREFQFICFTEDPSGLNENIVPMELLENWKGWWGKATIFAKSHGFDTGLNFFID
jgi:tetratricopeptide (TPR) repeat protein